MALFSRSRTQEQVRSRTQEQGTGVSQVALAFSASQFNWTMWMVPKSALVAIPRFKPPSTRQTPRAVFPSGCRWLRIDPKGQQIEVMALLPF